MNLYISRRTINSSSQRYFLQNMDDLHDLEYLSDNDDDQDSLDDQIELEQRRCNAQLWTSFQNAACCITKLYKDKAHPNVSPWIPFQSAASNLTTLYRDCIESQRRFARLGYQVGRRRGTKEYAKWLKNHKLATNKHQTNDFNLSYDPSVHPLQHNSSSPNLSGQLHISSNQATQQSNVHQNNQITHELNAVHHQSPTNHPTQGVQFLIGNNDDDLSTFHEALAHTKNQKPITHSLASSNLKRPCSNVPYGARAIEERNTSEEDRLLELNQFLTDEYHRHVGSRKRSSSNTGGNLIKRLRD